MRSGSIMCRKLARRWLRAIIMPPKVWPLVWVKLPASGLNCWGLQSRKVRSRVFKKWIPKSWIPPSSLPPWIYLAASVRRDGCYSFASLWLPLLMKKFKKSNLNSSHCILTQFFRYVRLFNWNYIRFLFTFLPLFSSCWIIFRYHEFNITYTSKMSVRKFNNTSFCPINEAMYSDSGY